MSLLGRLVELKELTSKVQIMAIAEDREVSKTLYEIEVSLASLIAKTATRSYDESHKRL